MVDTSAVEVSTTETRRLSVYPLEQLIRCDEKKDLLLLVAEQKDEQILGGLAKSIDLIQNNTRVIISGRKFYAIKCTIIEAGDHLDVRHMGILGAGYSDATFKKNFDTKRGGFRVNFDGTEINKHFNWRDVVEDSYSIKFFGSPLSMTRNFDKCYRGCTNQSTLYHRFSSLFEEFEGDVNSCQAILNSYLSQRIAILEKKVKSHEEDKSVYDKDLFRSKRVIEFLDRFDEMCRSSIQSVFLEFKDHSQPIISTPMMEEFLNEAPYVFGELYQLLLSMRNYRPN